MPTSPVGSSLPSSPQIRMTPSPALPTEPGLRNHCSLSMKVAPLASVEA
ncbi:Uncharacterised protein [Mycobacteroides abscessus subsp. abscessus]|nr:Uncharacterised protein [Mycobacteroides abscessus subsp. abscessus]